MFQALRGEILISAHLSSKKEKNPEQVLEMKKSIEKVRRVLPEYEIIIGGDINGPLEFGFQLLPEKNKPFSLHVYPNKDQHSTVLKKRTLMQAQKNKAN